MWSPPGFRKSRSITRMTLQSHAIPHSFWLQNKTYTVSETFPHLQDERRKLLGRGLWSLLACSARVPQGPDGAAAHDGAPRAGNGPVLRRPPRAAAALSPCSLRPDLVRPVQQHAGIIMDGPQGRAGQRTVWLCAGVKMRGDRQMRRGIRKGSLEGLSIDCLLRALLKPSISKVSAPENKNCSMLKYVYCLAGVLQAVKITV